MTSETEPKTTEVRGQIAKAHSSIANPELTSVIDQTVKLWRKHHLDYDHTKYVVEQVRKSLQLAAPKTRRRTVERLDRTEVEKLLEAGYQLQSKYGLLIKTLFYTGARVDEFIHIRAEDLFLNDSPPQIHITQAKRQSTRYVPILKSLAQELKTHLNGRKTGYLFESNRHTRYSARAIQDIVKEAARPMKVTKNILFLVTHISGKFRDCRLDKIAEVFGQGNNRSFFPKVSPVIERAELCRDI